MLKNFLIGIPVRNFKNPMSRLENVLSVEKRIELSKGMFENIVKSFENDETKIVCITNDELVIDYCKNNNIKIVSWFIDSISKEFLNGKKKDDFFKNLDFVDYCFVTSSPKLFKKHKFYKKLEFIPNPVDSSIDNFTNFKIMKIIFI